MPPSIPLMVNLRDFFALAPELALSVWGLVIIVADLGPFRNRTAEERRRLVGRVALAGTFVGLLAAMVPLIIRFDLTERFSWLNLARIDYVADPDPLLFLGTVSGDLLTDVFNLLFATLLLLIVGLSNVWSFTENWGEYYALLFWSTVGMMLLTASEEFLTLFLSLEMMSICLYLATAFEKTRRRSGEGALKYFIYGSVASALFLFGLSLLYGLTGTTQFYAIRNALGPFSRDLSGLSGNVAGATAVLLLLVGFGFKAGAVPFHQWVPDAYEGAPAPVTAWIATGSKIATFVALIKVLLHAVGPWASGPQGIATPGWIGVVAILSAASMTYGNFAALAQTNFKRMLAYSSIAHSGYMLVGVAAAGVDPRHAADATGAVLFYLVTYAFATIAAFSLAAWLARDTGSDEIEGLNGLASTSPNLAVGLLLVMLSLIGLPPLAGFFGKFSMFLAALDEANPERLTLIGLVALGLFNSVVSAFYYVRVLKAIYLRPASEMPLSAAPRSVSASIVLGAAVAVGFGVFPAPLLSVLKAAAVTMLAPSAKIGTSGINRTTPPGAATAVPHVDASMLSGAGRGVTPPRTPTVPGQGRTPVGGAPSSKKSQTGPIPGKHAP